MRLIRHVGILGGLVLTLGTGCVSSSLNDARRDYFNGNYQKAADALADKEVANRDKALLLMERGMMRQAAGDYEGSSRDFIEAYEAIDNTVALSVTKDTASMIINDNVQTFKGAPFERTLLHAFTAKNHLLQRNWDNAAVESRRIINSLKPEMVKDYPEDAYSRYMAGFGLSMIGDWSNAGLQYRLADQLAPHLQIDERTGYITPGTNAPDNQAAFPPANAGGHELVAFVLIGRSPTGNELHQQHRPVAGAGYAEIFIDGQKAGRSYELTDTVDLAFTTKQKDVIREMAKTVSRIAIKEATARSIEKDNALMGAMYRVIMIGLLEQPDVRRWETLPRSLQIARVPSPENPKDIEVRFTTGAGVVTRTLRFDGNLPANHRTRILVVRDSQPVL